MGKDSGARTFVQALAARDQGALEEILAEDTLLLAWAWDGNEAHRPRREAIDGLLSIAQGWRPATLEVLGVAEGSDTASAHFRVQSRQGSMPVDINGSVFLEFERDQIRKINLYVAQPQRAASREGIVRSPEPGPERDALIESLTRRWDVRASFGPGAQMVNRRGAMRLWTQVAHPSANQVLYVNWSDEEADARIAETIQWFREKGLGLNWTVSQFDRPRDLGERLVRHGFVHAGDSALMLRFGIDNLDDIPVNESVEVVELKQRPDLWEASLQITAAAFHWPEETTENERESWFEDLQTESIRSYMALVGGVPVADSHLYLQSGIAYLGGAATLPEHRSKRIYSTMLRRRLERARQEGYEVAMINAEPMSRRVVSRFGFETCAMSDVYGWMEPMDLDVIRKLVVDE